MQCDICFRSGGQKLPFLCPTDARNRLYECRLQNAYVLLEKDALDREISTLVANPARGAGQERDEKTERSTVEVTDTLAERQQAASSTERIIAHAEELRLKMEQARRELADRRAKVDRKKSELASATSGLAARKGRQTEDAEKSIRMTKYKWNQVHTITASSRAFLCGEAAKLYGLRRVRRSSGMEEYKIGGISIIDLRTLNAATPAHISTSLSHIVHLLMLSTHYLAVRLPAEITLPHRDYPLPTIFSISASYTNTDVPFPGTTPVQSSSNSPTDTRHAELLNQPRPRPLFIAKPLPVLANEDPAGYSRFLEGVTLLAYNIAWLCKSQGIFIGESNSFEDICSIGKNLYDLLIGSQSNGPPHKTLGPQPVLGRGTGREVDTDSEVGRNASNGPTMGYYSHGTAHTSLASAEGTDFIRSWKLLSPIKLADRLKSKLMSEVANSEWEVLDQDAWAIEDDMGGDGVVVGARRGYDAKRGTAAGMQSFMIMKTVMDAVEIVGGGITGDRERKPGTSGWTKLKPRG